MHYVNARVSGSVLSQVREPVGIAVHADHINVNCIDDLQRGVADIGADINNGEPRRCLRLTDHRRQGNEVLAIAWIRLRVIGQAM